MNKELIEILKCISEMDTQAKNRICVARFKLHYSYCAENTCINCILSSYCEYTPYLIKL